MADIFSLFEGDYATCKLGCIDYKSYTLFRYRTTNKTTVERHCNSKHPDFAEKYRKLDDSSISLQALVTDVDAVFAKTESRLKSLKAGKLRFSPLRNISNEMRSSLLLCAWACANGISRLALGDPLFDAFLKSIGSNMPVCRKALQTSSSLVSMRWSPPI
jgi:hypothetical protein